MHFLKKSALHMIWTSALQRSGKSVTVNLALHGLKITVIPTKNVYNNSWFADYIRLTEDVSAALSCVSSVI